VTQPGPAVAQRTFRRVSKIYKFSAFAIAAVCFLAVVLLAAQTQAPTVDVLPASYAAVSSTGALAEPPRFLYEGVPAAIPQDEGLAGLRFELSRLKTTARLMQVVAHPDDEDGGLLTLEARGQGASVLLMTLNRGEGGQNKIGSNLSDVLGVVRTEELLASDQHYGIQDRFSRVADFGFSKTAEETFQKWGGHDVALADMVRVIRTFRPDVLTTRFSGTPRDGHGNHQAAGILTKEAFRAAADPKRFPEQIAEGLQPWQAKKLYIGNVCGFGAMSCPDENWTLKINTGEYSPELGMSYAQFAMEGLRHQLSQGAGNWTLDPGDRFTFYKLADSVIPSTLDKNGHEKSFFDGIDTSLPGLASRLGPAEKNVPWFRQELTRIASDIAEAQKEVNGNQQDAIESAVRGLDTAITRLKTADLNAAAKSDLLQILCEKREQAETALNLALNVWLRADVFSGNSDLKQLPKEADALTTVSPGQEFTVSVAFHNGSKQALPVDEIQLEVPAGWSTINGNTKPQIVKSGEDLHADFTLRVPKDAAYTRPYWHRDNPETESINHIDNERYATLPFPPPPLRAQVKYTVANGGSVRATCEVAAVVATPFIDDSGKPRSQPLAIVPAFSVELEPGTQVISTHNGSNSSVKVGVTSNLMRDAHGDLHLRLPEGWRSEPSQLTVNFTHRGEKQDFQFHIFPSQLQEGRATIHAVLDSGGQRFSEGYTLITREDLGSFYYYEPARQRVSIVDVRVPHDLKIGYIMGAGDDIPTVLQQIGMNVTLIPAENLAKEDLSQFGTIVLGIRAYDTQKDVVANNSKLLDYVHAGGTLVVQYNTGPSEFNSENLTPYPADLSRQRVSVEEAPVTILAPNDSIFHDPNTISASDFDGWVQERGLYFMSQWDDHFTPLLSCHDPGEDAQKGGLLRAQYGKGTYIYTGFAFFRQLPAGVPGAVRLFVNILNAGHGNQ
jgi:LmbE family N-acetylglucosaminyl deacetylase